MMKTTRPNLHIPLSSRELYLEIASIVGVVSSIAILAVAWKSIPQITPSHFDFFGKPDAMGSKSGLLVMPCLTVFLYLLVTLLSRFPNTWNFPVNVTEENAERLYRVGRELIVWLKSMIIWFLTLAEWSMVRVSTGSATGLGLSASIGTGVFLVIIMTTVAIGISQMNRVK